VQCGGVCRGNKMVHVMSVCRKDWDEEGEHYNPLSRPREFKHSVPPFRCGVFCLVILLPRSSLPCPSVLCLPLLLPSSCS